MRRSDIYSGIVLALIALTTIYFIIPGQIDISEEFGRNARIFPLVTMWLAVAVALILIYVRLRETPETDEPDHMEETSSPMRVKNWLFIVIMSGFLATSYIAIEAVGFTIAAPAAVALLMAAMGEYRHPVRLVLVSLMVPTAIYYAFDRLFVIQLP